MKTLKFAFEINWPLWSPPGSCTSSSVHCEVFFLFFCSVWQASQKNLWVKSSSIAFFKFQIYGVLCVMFYIFEKTWIILKLETLNIEVRWGSKVTDQNFLIHHHYSCNKFLILMDSVQSRDLELEFQPSVWFQVWIFCQKWWRIILFERGKKEYLVTVVVTFFILMGIGRPEVLG